MKVNVTKNSVSITEYSTINSGERGVNLCEFQLPEEFSSLSVTAAFNNIPVPVCDGRCIIPTLKKGTVVLGVYAYKENADGVELMYSPKPTAFYVNEGSYSEEIGGEEIPTISEYEKFCKMFADSLLENVKDGETLANKTQQITEASTHDQYPTAKAVYDYVSESTEGMSKENVSAKRHYNTFSVLGDSYSTFVDFVTPNTNLCWYPAGNANATGSNNDVSRVEQMWWHIFANQYESALQVNNSYSGSPICYDGWGSGTTDSTETGFIARAKNIGAPELIFILGGSNDDWVNASIGEYKYADWVEDDFVSFRPSLAYLLNYLKQHNAGARIVFILNEKLDSQIDESVLTICSYYGVEVLELENITTTNGHPTVAGQQSIAQQVFDFITSSKITEFTASISKNNFASGITLNDLKPYLTVTAAYDDGTTEKITDYVLRGSVDVGANTITISYGVYTTTVDIVVSEVELTSISAELSQTEFNMGATLDSIKPYLTVTGHYADGSTSVVNDYTLSGELVTGENVVTVTYGGKTATVNITVAVESGTYQLSVETLDAPNYQYYCPVFNTSVNESVRIVFTRDFERFNNGNGTIKAFDSLPTNYKNGVQAVTGIDYSAEYVDQTVELTSDKTYFAISIPTAAVNPLTLKNFHCYVDGVEVEPVKWISLNGNEVTAVKLA